MNAAGPTTNSGATANTAASTSPRTIIALRGPRSAIHPNSGSPSSLAAGHAATTMPSVGRSTPCCVK